MRMQRHAYAYADLHILDVQLDDQQHSGLIATTL